MAKAAMVTTNDSRGIGMKFKQRIEELERKVKELEARPVFIPYPVYPAPVSIPVPYPIPYIPYIPQPHYPPYPLTPWYITTCGGAGDSNSNALLPYTS